MLKKLLDSPDFKIVMRHLPTLLLVFAAALSIFYGRAFSFESLLQLKPRGLIAAAVFFMFIYAIKSMSYLVPIIVIYAAVGTLFPISFALIINVAGASIVVTIPYWLGYYRGAGFMGTLFSKFPKIEDFIKKREENSWLVSCLPRTIVFAPLKTVSIYLGSIKIPFYKYLFGSLTGILPMLVSVTVIGKNITEPNSAEFIVAAIIIVVSAWCSLAFYFFSELQRKRRER
jgi:uncharacterized membrane protein YdjX (TVP38/TMEM64 family)